MNKTTKPKLRSPVVPGKEVPAEVPRSPQTTDDCIDNIRALGVQITEHVQFMCTMSQMTGTSAEAKRKAATIFWERLKGMEKELARIREELFLG